jgi:hypothetical protein
MRVVAAGGVSSLTIVRLLRATAPSDVNCTSPTIGYAYEGLDRQRAHAEGGPTKYVEYDGLSSAMSSEYLGPRPVDSQPLRLRQRRPVEPNRSQWARRDTSGRLIERRLLGRQQPGFVHQLRVRASTRRLKSAAKLRAVRFSRCPLVRGLKAFAEAQPASLDDYARTEQSLQGVLQFASILVFHTAACVEHGGVSESNEFCKPIDLSDSSTGMNLALSTSKRRALIRLPRASTA